MPSTVRRIELPERYRVIRHVASGGMAAVWLAEDSVLARPVAIKVLSGSLAADPRARLRFEREARAAARVSGHPNVVTIHDVGEHAGSSFMVMEFLDGGSVDDRLRTGRSVAPAQALAWLRQAAAALDHAHREGVVHRDVKPANLLLDRRGRLAVADFGIARLVTETPLTQTGHLLGTAAYLSPEQAAGRETTPASDRYSLAVVAYELLAGRRPFDAEHPAAQARLHLEADPPPSGLPAPTEDALRRGLAKDPADRPPSAAALVAGLAEGLDVDPEPTAATHPLAVPAADGAPASAERRWGPAAALLALAAAALIAGGALALTGGDGGEQTAPAPQAPNAAPAEPAAEPPDEPAAAGGPPAPDGRSAHELNLAGFQRLRAGDPQGAIPLLEASVAAWERQDDPDARRYGYALYNLGIAYLDAGRPADAERVLERRLEVSPDDQRADVESALARARAAQGDEDEGEGGDDGEGRPGNGKAKGKDKKGKGD